ncbi:VOC family protein [Rhodovastum atsumiense]|uniref:VOC family protein n=1 Tax=Rhodovastum atsumiense TaxID=504468 RepID=A0A5M6IKV7_9PROT|nr:VOC family protein [Rhodovastum atsumiense]KAA5608499.1 VOC family protein [Rhodovastum atsumiense]CAH2599283.1 VOC family protein [Rhodovastum atsumiense]
MISHLSIAVADYARARAFYDAALAPLGLRVRLELPQAAGYGPAEIEAWDDPGGAFWITSSGDPAERIAGARGFHIAFTARTRRMVDGFHAAALAAGGRDNGAPGLRAQYHPQYYAAFVIDPDGWRLEAVCHRPEP